MTCENLEAKIRDFLIRVPLHSPLKTGQTVIIRVNECNLEIRKKLGNNFDVIQTLDCEDKLIITLKSMESFEYLFDSKTLLEYGNRLVEVSIRGAILLNPGPYKDPMLVGYHRFIGYRKPKKGLESYCWIIPVF